MALNIGKPGTLLKPGKWSISGGSESPGGLRGSGLHPGGQAYPGPPGGPWPITAGIRKAPRRRVKIFFIFILLFYFIIFIIFILFFYFLPDHPEGISRLLQTTVILVIIAKEDLNMLENNFERMGIFIANLPL